MLGFFKKNAVKGRFVEIAKKDGEGGQEIADKITTFIKDADFSDPYPEFTVSKSDLDAARISEYHLLSYINHIANNKKIEYTKSHPEKKDGFHDYSTVIYFWERVLFEYPKAKPAKVIVVKK